MTQTIQLSDIDSLSTFTGFPLVLLDMHGVIITSSRNIPNWLDYHDLGEPIAGRMLLFFDEAGQSLSSNKHPLNRILETGESIRETSFCISRDDTGPVMALVSMTPVTLDDDRPGILLAIHPGEADGKTGESAGNAVELQARLTQFQQNYVRMLTMIHHDLKSPLMGLAGVSEINLKNQGKVSPEENLRLAKMLQRTAQHTYQMFDKLFSWALTQSHAIKCLQKPLDLRLVLQENLQLISHSAEQKNIQLDMECPEDIWVFADETMLVSIVQNIISNGIKFTAQGGKVFLSVHVRERDVQIKIRDSGVGMNEETLGKLFQSQLKATRPGTAGEKGSGLGLLLSKDFIEKNGGQLSIQSELDKGSEFTFTLPLFGGMGLPKQTA